MIDRLLRKLVPSVPLLARTPVAPLLDVADAVIMRRHPEWAHLPPASLRMRIGVGNKILRNHQFFIESANELVGELESRRYLKRDSSILELGCGCGRNAIAFSRYVGETGRYVGQDVDREMIGWCQQHLQNGRSTFSHAEIYSSVYNPGGMTVEKYRFPADDRSISLIVSVSVFSHLLPKEFSRYVAESARVLIPRGYLHMTLFLMDFLSGRMGDRWTFAHRIDQAYVENMKYPESAVAYDLADVEKMLAGHGLRVVEIYNRERHQQTLIAEKQ